MTTVVQSLRLQFVHGDATGLTIPADTASLLQAGADFLTAAFHRFGTLAPDNRVTRIVDSQSFAGGNSGHKLCLTIEYARSDPGLHRDLFVKFSRDFDDVFRDRRRHELEAEVRLATLSRLPAFPVRVPFACFADFNHESGTGLLITERIAFGRDGIEPLHRKCMDQASLAHGVRDPILLRDPVAHGFLHVFTNFLNLWEHRDFGASLDSWLASRSPSLPSPASGGGEEGKAGRQG